MAKKESEENPHVPSHTQRSPSVDRDKQTKELERRAKQLRFDFAITFGTPEGKRVLQWLIRESGFHKSSIGGNPTIGMDVQIGTIYNEARKSLYLEMRQLIPAETLKQCEYENINEVLE